VCLFMVAMTMYYPCKFKFNASSGGYNLAKCFECLIVLLQSSFDGRHVELGMYGLLGCHSKLLKGICAALTI
jgi:hypothetical protein